MAAPRVAASRLMAAMSALDASNTAGAPTSFNAPVNMASDTGPPHWANSGGHSSGLLGNIFGLIPSPLRTALDRLIYLPNLVTSAGAEAVGGLSGALGSDHLKGPSVLSTIFNPSDQITAGDLISGNQARNITGTFAKYGGEGKGALGFQGSPALQTAGTVGLSLAADPLTYLTAGFGGGADAAASEVATRAGKQIAELGGEEAAAHSPEIASKIADIKSAASDAINAVRKGGPSALTADESAMYGIRRGVGLRLPGDHYIPLTPGTGPLAEVSQARHALQQNVLEHVLGGAGDLNVGEPTALGKLFGKSDPAGAALARSTTAPNAFENTVARLVSRTEAAQTGRFATDLSKDFYKALKATPEAEVKAALKEGGVQGLVDHVVASAGGPVENATRQLFDGGERAATVREAIGNRLANETFKTPQEALARYAKVGGQELASHAKAESLLNNYGLAGRSVTPAGPADLQAAIESNQNALQGALAKQQEVQSALASPQVEAQAAPDPLATREAAQAAKAHPNPQAEAQSLATGTAAPPAGSPEAPAPASPAPIENAAQATTGGAQGVSAPLEVLPSRATQALEAAKTASSPEAQAAADAVKQEIAAAKETIASNPKSGPARYNTPYKVKMWAHANALGISTDQSATRIEAALKKVVREQEATSSPAFAEAATHAEATKAAIQSSPQESASALQAHSEALAKEIPNATSTHAVAAKADTQIDQTGLRVKDPAYAHQQSQKFQQTIASEIASGKGTPDAAEVLAQHQAWGDVAAQAVKDANPKLAETAQLNQTALEIGHQIDLLRASGKRLAAIDSTQADQIARVIHRAANEYSGFRSIANGIEAPNDVADMLARAHDVARTINKPGGLLKTYDGLLRGYKAGKLATPGFQVRLVFGHTFANLLARVRPEAYAGWARAEVTGGAHLEPGVWEQMNSGIGMGQAAHEGSYLRGQLQEPARLIEGHTMPWENKAVQAVNPLSTRGPLARATQTGAEAIQRQFRGALMYDRMVLKGQSFDQAIQDMYRFHFNYSDLSAGDKALRRIVPFYTFMRNNIPLQVQMLVEHPQIALRVAQAQQAIGKSSNPLIPGALLDTAASPLTAAVGQLTDPKGTAAGMLTPALTGPAEWMQMNAVARSNASNPDSATNVWGQGFVSGKPLLLDELPIPKILKDVAVSAGLAKRVGGATYMSADRAFALQKAIPPLANFVRNTSGQPNIQKNRLANQMRFWLGVNIPPPTPDQSQFAKIDTKNAAQAQRQIGHDVLGGQLYPPRKLSGSGSGFVRKYKH